MTRLFGWLSELWRALLRKPSPETTIHVDAWESGWTWHPCTLPSDISLVHINNIWCCPKEGCGRRFKAISRNRGYTPGEGYLNTIVWEEQMPALPLSEDEIAALLEGGLEDD